MRMPSIVLGLSMFSMLLAPGICHAMTADEIIAMADSARHFDTESFTATMTISKSSRKLVKTFTGYGMKQGNKSYMKFTNPEDAGVKYLKIGDELWTYLPDAQDTLKISGHMLRQGMMGSDISYDDMMENEVLRTKYKNILTGRTHLSGHDCYRIDMTAVVDDIAYYKRDMYVDVSTYLPVRMDLYAKSGRLLKRMDFGDFQQVSGKWIYFRMQVSDTTKRDSITSLIFSSIQFDVGLPSDAFSMSRLRK